MDFLNIMNIAAMIIYVVMLSVGYQKNIEDTTREICLNVKDVVF